MTTEIVPHFFPMASCQFTDNDGVHVCLYYQSPDGAIREHRNKPNGALVTTTIVGKQMSILTNTPIAVASCDEKDSPEAGHYKIHLFYLNKDLNICKCKWFSGKWSGYDVIRVSDLPVTAAPFSQLASAPYTADSWPSYKPIVFYQDESLQLREFYYDPLSGKWHNGCNSIKRNILAGSSLATSNSKAFPGQVWCYFQDTDCTFREVYYKYPSYYLGGYNPNQEYNYRPGSSVSCVLYGYHLSRVYNVTPDNYLAESFWDGNRWHKTTIINNTKTTTNSSITVVRCGGVGTSTDRNASDLSLRIFYQTGNQQIHELALDDGKWTNKGLFVDNSDVPSAEMCYRGAIAAD